MQWYETKLVRKRKCAAHTWELAFSIPESSRQFIPGQYVAIKLYGTYAVSNYREMSIASTPEEGIYLILTKEGMSDYKHALLSLETGDIVQVSDPIGACVLPQIPCHLIALTGGVGIAPVRSMFLSEDTRMHTISLYASFSHYQDVVYVSELEQYAMTYPNRMIVSTITGQDASSGIPWSGQYGRFHVDTLRATVTPDDMQRMYMVIGGRQMVDETVDTLLASGVNGKTILAEYFSGYPQDA